MRVQWAKWSESMSGVVSEEDRQTNKLSPKEVVAAYHKKGYNVSYSAVIRMCNSGQLKGAVKIGGCWFVPEESL